MNHGPWGLCSFRLLVRCNCCTFYGQLEPQVLLIFLNSMENYCPKTSGALMAYDVGLMSQNDVSCLVALFCDSCVLHGKFMKCQPLNSQLWPRPLSSYEDEAWYIHTLIIKGWSLCVCVMHVLPWEFLKHYGLNCNDFNNYFVGVHRWQFRCRCVTLNPKYLCLWIAIHSLIK